MSKKSLDRKAASQFTIDNRDNGKTDQEIYNELAQQYHDKKAVALLIKGTATKANKEKYKPYNNLLLGLIGFTILAKIFMAISLFLAEAKPWLLLFVFIIPLLNVFFFYEIARYNAPIYRFCGWLTIAGFFQSVSKMSNTTDIILSLVLSAAIATLSFYLDNKLFPNYRPNSLRKDANGEYILG